MNAIKNDKYVIARLKSLRVQLEHTISYMEQEGTTVEMSQEESRKRLGGFDFDFIVGGFGIKFLDGGDY